jgi:hypothetical protein
MFAAGAIACVIAFSFGRSRLLPPALVACAFVSTTIYSYAVLTIAYVAGAVAVVVLVAALGWIVRPPLFVR